MRISLFVLAGLCALTPALAHAQGTAKPQTPPPAQGTTAKPAAPSAGNPAADLKEVKVSPKVLQTYVGAYEMNPGRNLNITLEDGYLHGEPDGQQKRQLFAASPTKFFLKDLPVVVTFKVEKGKVTGLLMQQEGRPDREAPKVK